MSGVVAWRVANHSDAPFALRKTKPTGWACVQPLVLQSDLAAAIARAEAAEADSKRLDYIEQKFSGVTNRERYLPVQMIWGKGCNGRTLREACDKYMKRDAAIDASREVGNG